MTSELRVDKIHNEGGDNDSGLDMSTNDTVKINIAGAKKVEVDSSGRVIMGTATTSYAHANADDLIIGNVPASGETRGITIVSGTDASGTIHFSDGTSTGNSNIEGQIAYAHNDDSLRFMIASAECMRIRSAGQLMVGRTTAIASGGVNSNHTFEQTTDGVWAIATHGDQTNNYGMTVYYATAHDGTGNHFLYCTDTGANRLRIQSDGDVLNHDNTYGSTSDERIKQDIKDANSQWDDIKALKVRNFKKKDDVRQYKDKAWEQIGVIAQELEAAGMTKLITESPPDEHDIKSSAEFGTLNEDGTIKEVKAKVKEVKYSVLYMKAVKALQEAMTRIETLETKVAALEAK
jgi:hypothetical protein